MKRNILIWAGLGFLIASAWAIYPLLNGSTPVSTSGLLWTIIQVTCPVVLASFKFHVPVYFYWAILANAVTYAVMGTLVETLRHSLRTAD